MEISMILKSRKTVWGEVRLYDITQEDMQFLNMGRKPFVDFIPSGKLIAHDHNVITDGGDERIAELVGGLSTDFVSKMGIGDGGVSGGDPLVPLAPTKADTALGHELVRHDPITSVTLITSPDFQIQFAETFFTNDPSLIPFTGADVINEAGLYASDDVLFARKTFVPIPFGVADRIGSICQWSLHVL